MDPITLYAGKAAEALLSKAASAVWEKLTKTSVNPAFAKAYRKWRDSLAGGDDALNTAYEAFFDSDRTAAEFKKVLADGYEMVDFDALVVELQASFSELVPLREGVDPADFLDELIRLLHDDLAAVPEFREKYQTALQRAMGELGKPGARIRNHSLARRKYLLAVAGQHRYIHFAGMGSISGKTELERTKIFVMPRVESGKQPEKDAEPVRANELLTGPNRRVVILGGPGSGKTTLLESFTLALTRREAFWWAASLPRLLPVVCRVRELSPYLQQHPANVWDFLQYDAARKGTGMELPPEFFRRAMESTGLLVLFDGLDEATSPERRNDVVECVSAFAGSLQASSRVVITSRPYDYREVRSFEAAEYAHFDLCPFDDEEIQQFFGGWSAAHHPGDPPAAEASAAAMWRALEERDEVKELARIPLLATMIARVHFGSGVLPEGRLKLYEKCAEMLLHHWKAEVGPPLFEPGQKEKFLTGLAFEMQSEEGENLGRETNLLIERRELLRRLEDSASDPHAVVDRLHKRDGILVDYGDDRFGFVHRSFQEYFAAGWMTDELDDADFHERVWANASGWNETLYLAVAQLKDRRRRSLLVELLEKSRVEFALSCVRAAGTEDPWLAGLVRFLSKYYWSGWQYAGKSDAECADLCLARPETRREAIRVLQGLFEKKNREGPALAAAVELAEEFGARGVGECRDLLAAFFGEAAEFGLNGTDRMAPVDGFQLNLYPVTNREYECMVPAHARQWDDSGNDPVVNVSSYEARLFCRWRGSEFRLPSEEEWYKAAAWNPELGAYRKYPWEDAFDARKCNTAESKRGRTTPVDKFAEGRSYYGCYDMAGNVWEWTSSPWDASSEALVLRGGSWFFNLDFAACAYRYFLHPAFSYDYLGFRCARTSR